jgi:parallel beta-helix repeat protein
MKYNILIFSFLLLIIGVMEVSATSDSIDINIMPNNLNDAKKAGIGFADREGIDIIERSEKFIITSKSKDQAIIYIPVQKPDGGKNWQDAYTITHYNETGHPLSDKTTVPHLINESWYVVFKNTDWSYLEVGGVMQFWDATDIPTLYTAISDNSKISLSGGIYTMHIPFYQNKSTDNFYFGETVHLKTVVGTAVAYYRWAGNTTFNNAVIHAWNTTNGTIVMDASIARSYIYSDSDASGDITNCNMSYLGYGSWAKYGVFLEHNSDITIINNTYNHNHYGICLYLSCNNNTLTGNNASGNIEHGIYLSASCNNTLADNNASWNTQYGICLYVSSNNTLTGNKASGNTQDGIYLYSSCNNNTLTGNNAFGNTQHGIRLSSSCNNNTLTGNNASWNTQYGICLYVSSNNTLTGNKACGNTQDGIYLYSSCNNNTLTGNNASGNTQHGIRLSSSCNNTLTSNIISLNTDYGVRLSSSSYNTLTNNYFNNINNAYDTGYNAWNITPTMGANIFGGSWLGGNYWSDYMGVDQTCDGLGDTLTPYNVGITNGGDYHPLVQFSLPTLTDEIKLITSEITLGLKGINMGNYLVYAFILIGILLIILGIQIITNNIYRR